jgi:hypothetical protein
VVISEALRLAKEFASSESSRFVNGVLDAAARRLGRDAGDTGDEAQDAKTEEQTRGREREMGGQA